MGQADYPTITLMHQIAALSGYLIGSIPFGIVMAKLFGLGDLRSIGSGNIGATNVLRTGNKPAAFLTLVLDAGKGAIVVLLFLHAFDYETTLARQYALLGGLMAVIGHNFSIFLRFQGGKGVATTLGTLLAYAWPVGLGACATWLVVALVLRYSSLAALVALAGAPVYALYLSDSNTVILALALGLLAFARHHENIRRLIRGKESKIGKKKPD
ncbi:glycerol-3-phosphate 1-O-acyltransferase PlsY [Magnetospira sp. QH-2]|uniref:glycerol-3-phosphate 1-O-acyltransferase PlsY n=1 Tax=Magnetospira sp. (strain QH-2) TaxID=1288970 RepID=UPI0003E8114C|nr:glycerol-3-phosphate 1-O-acyltransferase PlsY [Magnetospira sp. QH-2]CCQ72582.1 Glycerol-3-phosphate acyltransferase [Magnetospira sp. QH-2]